MGSCRGRCAGKPAREIALTGSEILACGSSEIIHRVDSEITAETAVVKQKPQGNLHRLRAAWLCLPTSSRNSRNRVGGFRPHTHHRTCLLWHTAVSQRMIGPGTKIPAATLYLSSSDTLTTPPHRYVDSDLHRFPFFWSRLRTFQYFLALLLYVLRFEWLPTP